MNLERKEQTCCLTNKEKFPFLKKISIFLPIFFGSTLRVAMTAAGGLALHWVLRQSACLYSKKYKNLSRQRDQIREAKPFPRVRPIKVMDPRTTSHKLRRNQQQKHHVKRLFDHNDNDNNNTTTTSHLPDSGPTMSTDLCSC